MKQLIILIDLFFNQLANALKWILFIALILGAGYLSYRMKVEITKQAIIEANQNK